MFRTIAQNFYGAKTCLKLTVKFSCVKINSKEKRVFDLELTIIFDKSLVC